MNPTRFRRRLLAWFDQHQRVLPWRGNRDPYRIWVSEVMLQQTTVAAVISYFNRFIAAFPDIKTLASADEQEVLHLWQGLGYYRRARHLHQAARRIVELGGDLPDDPHVWAELPGVGRYILGAVLSQAFDRRIPIVEANSQRVLSRLFSRRGDLKTSATQKWLWQMAEELLPRKRVGDFNQAMMELGALICVPVQPGCEQCPVRADCKAFADGMQDRIPAKPTGKSIEQVREVAVIIRRGTNVLIAQRPDDAHRWRAMWEFPQTELQAGETHEKAATRWVRQKLGVNIALGSELASIKYVVTRFRLTLTALTADYRSGKLLKSHYARFKWESIRQLGKYPASTAQRKLMALAGKESTQLRLC